MMEALGEGYDKEDGKEQVFLACFYPRAIQTWRVTHRLTLLAMISGHGKYLFVQHSTPTSQLIKTKNISIVSQEPSDN